METCLGNIRRCIEIMLIVFDSYMFEMYFYIKKQSNLPKNERVTAVVHELLGQPSYIYLFAFLSYHSTATISLAYANMSAKFVDSEVSGKIPPALP